MLDLHTFLAQAAFTTADATTRARFDAIRGQVALARALLDEVERVAPSGAPPEFADQAVEELARLGCRLIETSAALARDTEAACGPGLARAAQHPSHVTATQTSFGWMAPGARAHGS